MKISYKQILMLFTCMLYMACEDESGDFPQAASLQVVHAASGAPNVHVNYFGLDDLNFSINPDLGFGATGSYTLPAGESRNIRFTYSEDTTREVFSQSVKLRAGEISTFFLLGDSTNLSSVLIEDTNLQLLRDSANAVRFINLSEDVSSVNVGLGDSSVIIDSDLTFSNASDFIEFDATLENPSYTFTFKNDADSVLASFPFEQWQVFIIPDSPPFILEQTFRKNITLALIGKPDDGEGNNTLQIVRIDNF